METIQKVQLRVHGKVQGVYFRASTQQKARQLGITGFVKNVEDGSVYIEAEGQDDKLEQFIHWCRFGPSSARVDGVDIQWADATGLQTFLIHY